jgi:hypothetical protein
MMKTAKKLIQESVKMLDADAAEITALRAEVDRMRAALDLYREAVRIDATMEGPRFMGANSSALKRAWDADCAALKEPRT